METFLIKALQLVLALVILVTVHEFGHYIFARMFGVRVNRFYLFFNPWFSLLKYDPMKGTLRILSRDDEHSLATFQVSKPRQPRPDGKPTWRDTIYGLGWVPLGGYCDIAGMVDETKSAKDLPSEPQPWEFRSKAAWKRLLVMVAGVLFNFLLAIAIYIGIAFHWGEQTLPLNNVDEGMDFTEVMHNAGFQDGDVILGANVDGTHYSPDSDNFMWEMIQPGAKVEVRRNGRDTVILVNDKLMEQVAEKNEAFMQIRVPVFVEQTMGNDGAAKAGLQKGDRLVAVNGKPTPSLTEFFPALADASGTTANITILRNGHSIQAPVEVNSDGKIGIQLRSPLDIYKVKVENYTFLEAIPRGWNMGVNQLVAYVSSLKLIFTPAGAKSIGGFGTLGSLFPEKWNWLSFWRIAAFLSVILAFMNIIPIPMLDGGYTLFLLVEIVTRRKPSERFIEVANMIGFGFLLLLLVYANLNDAVRFLF